MQVLSDVSMADKVESFKNTSLDAVLTEPLPFKIPVTDIEWVTKFPDSLCLGRAEYTYAVDTWLERKGLFVSETSVTSLDQTWINVVCFCLRGSVLYLNQHDPSSAVRLRPDTTIMKDGALLLKGEAKLNATEVESACEQLRNSFFPESIRCFPLHSRAVIGVVTCNVSAVIFKVSRLNGQSLLNLHRHYNLQNTSDRLAFIVDIFKVLRWMASVTFPVSAFHMIPSVRRVPQTTTT